MLQARLTVMTAIALLTSGLAYSSEWKLLDIDYAAVDYREIQPGKREGYMPERDGQWRKGANFYLELRLLKYFRWDNNLHMDGGKGRLHHAGWEYQLLMDKYQIQPFYYHHSQHALEQVPNGTRFPVEDSYGLRLEFINKRKGRK